MRMLTVITVIAGLATGSPVVHAQPARETGELLLFYISAPECCADEGFGQSIAKIKDQLGARAKQAGVTFRSVGIAIGQTGPGIRYLMEGRTSANTVLPFGPWDEVHAGGGWNNQVLVQYIWRAQTVPAAFPQLVMIERVTSKTDRGQQFGPDVVIASFGGSKPMLDWLASGLPLPKSRFLK